jgi:hypothetical protein
VSKDTIGMEPEYGYAIGVLVAIFCTISFEIWYFRKFIPMLRTNKFGERIK